MANVLTRNPLVIDTAFAIGASPAPQRCFVKRVVWAKQSAGSHRLHLTDRDGITILDVVSSAANDTMFFNLDTWTNGIVCAVIDSGVCEVYI